MRRFLLGTFAALLLASLALPWLALDDAATVEAPAGFRRGDLAWVKSLLEKHDPRRQTPGVVHSLRLDEAELNRLLNYAVVLRRVRGVSAEIDPGMATLAASLRVPANPWGDYLNVEAELVSTPAGVDVTALRLGALPVPGALADWLAKRLHARLREDSTYAALADAFQTVHFSEHDATLDYRWHPDLLAAVERKSADLLMSETDKLRMLKQADRLGELLAAYPAGANVPLIEILPPLFAGANRLWGDAAEENRAALSALAAYLAGVSLPALLREEAGAIRRAPRHGLVLHGRRDFAEHYLISAALTANAGRRFASAVGLIKEEQDAGRGSGFSFTDLAVDRAGVALGEAAVGPDAGAVQKKLADARHDAELLPDFRGLPEFMPKPEFDRRYGPIGGPRYQVLIEQIDARIAAHPLLR